VSEDLQRHLRSLARLGTWGKLRYFFLRLKNKSDNQIAAIAKRLKSVRANAYVSARQSLPPHLRSAYILNVYRLALRSYVPQPYAGRVSMVKETGNTYKPRFDWSRLLGGDLEVLELSGGHMDLRNEPFVRIWAARLRESLNRLYESHRGRNQAV
jgi:hypothetical protein